MSVLNDVAVLTVLNLDLMSAIRQLCQGIWSTSCGNKC